MANYFVINSKFEPYSFDELIKPYQMYATEYRRQEEAMDKLLENAASLEDLSETLDSEEYAKYKDWKDRLKGASDQLSLNGLSMQLADNIRNLNTQYRLEQLPLVSKLKKRGELVKEQREYLAKNPNTIYDIYYTDTPVSQVSEASTYTPYNLDTIQASVGQDVLSKRTGNEEVPTIDQYTEKYSKGLEDEESIERVKEAVTAGMSLGNATYKQKEFDNYIKEITAKKTRSGSGSGSGSGYYGPQQTNQPEAVQLFDGSYVIPKYNKSLKKYQIKDRNGKDVVLSEKPTAEDVLKGYYGGDYESIVTPWGSQPSISTKDDTGKMQYYVYMGKNRGWERATAGKSTTVADLYKQWTKESISTLGANDRLKGLNGRRIEEIQKGLERTGKRRFTRGELTDDYTAIRDIFPDVYQKLELLRGIGVQPQIQYIFDNTGATVGFEVFPNDEVLNTKVFSDYRP